MPMGKRINWAKVKGLGKRPDEEIALELGVTLNCVRKARCAAGIVRNTGPIGNRIDWRAQGLGLEPDADIARRLGVQFATVQMHRIKLGIPKLRMQRFCVDTTPQVAAIARKTFPGVSRSRAVAKLAELAAAHIDKLVIPGRIVRPASSRRRPPSRAAASRGSRTAPA